MSNTGGTMDVDMTLFSELTDEELYVFLRRERHNAARARAFDEAYPKFLLSQKAWCDRQIEKLTVQAGLNEVEAKTLLAVLLIFYHAKVDEQDKLRAHGETIQAEIEWAQARKNRMSRSTLHELQQVS